MSRVKRNLMILLVTALLVAWAAGESDSPADGGPGLIDAETAEEYNEFRDEMDERKGRIVEYVVERYKLGEVQQVNLKTIVGEHFDEFVETQAWRMFGMKQRWEALEEVMQETGLSWVEVPMEIKQDLFREALAMMDGMSERVTAFADEFAEELDAEQAKLLASDLRRMRWGMRIARFQMRLMAGWAKEEDRPEDPDGEGEGRRDRYRKAASGPGRLEAWNWYVWRFIKDHRLDELQKRQAWEMLAKYKAKAKQLYARSASQPTTAAATRPATQPATAATSQPTTAPTSAPTTRPGGSGRSVAAFRRKLDRVRAGRQDIVQLFAQLKAELDTIPTPVQRKLAADEAERRHRRSARTGEDRK